MISAKEANNKAIQGLQEIEEYQTGNKKLLDDVFKQNKDLIDVLKKHHDRLDDLGKLENTFNDLNLQVEETQNELKNYVDKMNVRLIDESRNLTLIVEKFQTELEEKQKEIIFLRNGFYALGIVLVIVVLFLFFKGM